MANTAAAIPIAAQAALLVLASPGGQYAPVSDVPLVRALSQVMTTPISSEPEPAPRYPDVREQAPSGDLPRIDEVPHPRSARATVDSAPQ